MSKKIRIAVLSLAAALFIALPASAVTVGGNPGTVVEVSSKIQSIHCNYQSSSEAVISIHDTSGNRHKGTYTATNVNGTWCKAKVKELADKFVAAGLAKDYSESSIFNDTGHKSVELLNLQTGSSGSPGGTDPTDTGDPDPATPPDFGTVESDCTSILPPEWCEGEVGIANILALILNIMTMGIGILATIGIVISGIQWLTARDKEDQIVKAKNRLFNIVIGIVVWGIMWLVLSWLLPGGISLEI